MVDSMVNSIFMQDNASSSSHTAKAPLPGFKANINVMVKCVWPANSPDLNPIENLWAILEEKLKSGKNTLNNLTYLENHSMQLG